MACVFTTGRGEPCKDAIGGLKVAYSIDFTADSFTVVAGEGTALAAGVTVSYQFDLNATGNTFTETATADNDAGTTTYAQELKLSFKKQTKASAAEIHLLLKARPVWVVKDRNGSYKVMGISDGTTGTSEGLSGGGKEEFTGYNLTFTATETEPAPYLDSSTTTAFLAVVSGTQETP